MGHMTPMLSCLQVLIITARRLALPAVTLFGGFMQTLVGAYRASHAPKRPEDWSRRALALAVTTRVITQYSVSRYSRFTFWVVPILGY